MPLSAKVERELADLSPDLRPRVRALIEACPHRIGITSAWRSRAEQQRLYDGWKRRLPGFNPANPPGVSKHEHSGPGGIPAADACDLSYPGGRKAIDWAHAHASEFGLCFPIRRENWHAESNHRPFRQDPPAPPVIEEDDVLNADDKKWIEATFTRIADDRLRILLRAEKADGTPTGHPNLTEVIALLHDVQADLK